MNLGCKGNISICKKCCAKHSIVSLAHFFKLKELRERVEYKAKWQL
jgi:hypothetical protein